MIRYNYIPSTEDGSLLRRGFIDPIINCSTSETTSEVGLPSVQISSDLPYFERRLGSVKVFKVSKSDVNKASFI